MVAIETSRSGSAEVFTAKALFHDPGEKHKGVAVPGGSIRIPGSLDPRIPPPAGSPERRGASYAQKNVHVGPHHRVST